MIDKEYPSLSRALILNDQLTQMIQDSFSENPGYLDSLDQLFNRLFELECRAIPEKMADVNDLEKMKSALAEMEIGRVMAETGFAVTFLKDNYFERKSPDILIRKGGTMAFIEVMRINDDPALDILLRRLRKFLKGKSYRIDMELDEYLSLPAIGHEEMRKHEKEVEESCNKFEELFRESDLNYEIATEHIKYEITPIPRNDGYPGIIMHEGIVVPEEKWKDYVKYRLGDKAEKRDTFPEDQKKVPFLIGVVSELMDHDDLFFKMLLYGTSASYTMNERWIHFVEKDFEEKVNEIKNGPEWKKILKAKDKGREDMLLRVYLIPRDFTYICEYGSFVTDHSMRNVTGVLLMKPTKKVHYFPNPFADDDIDCQGLWDQLKAFINL